jgi:hypothetical protein
MITSGHQAEPIVFMPSTLWGAEGGDLLNTQYSWAHYGDQKEKTVPKDLKR